jgi:hypothetical protein
MRIQDAWKEIDAREAGREIARKVNEKFRAAITPRNAKRIGEPAATTPRNAARVGIPRGD